MGAQKAHPSNSAQDNTDIINNLYDLGSNLYEFTQEANGANHRVLRGGSYDASKQITPSSKTDELPTSIGDGVGSRLALYAISTTDSTGPSVTINSLTATTNSISIAVKAVDRESRSR